MLRTTLRLACAASLLTGVMATSAAAQMADKRTLFTFSGPVAMPGVTLPAGQYIFRLADPSTSSKVVQVLSADGRRAYGLFFSMPAERVEPSATPEVRFMETARDMPAAIKTWWYPGERRGYEFIYPKEQARRLAQGATQPVLTTQNQTSTTAQTNTADLSRVSSGGDETDVSAEAAPVAAAPSGTTQEGTVASSTISIPNAVIPAASSAGERTANASSTLAARTELPQTASLMPTVTAIGVVALVSGLAIWGWRSGRLPIPGRRG